MSFSRVGDGVPLNVKGQILTHTGTYLATLPVGTDGQILVSQSSASSGLAWQSVNAGDTQYVNLISSAALTANAHEITFSSIPSTYDDLLVILYAQRYDSVSFTGATVRINANTNTVYRYQYYDYQTGGQISAADTSFPFSMNGISFSPFEFYFSGYKTSFSPKPLLMKGGLVGQDFQTDGAPGQVLHGMWNSSDAITSITFFCGTPTQTTRIFDSSSDHFALLYGIKRS